MIQALYDWMKNIIVFMIFTTVIMNLLGKSNYKKYAGLVSGLILVLLVIGPILSITKKKDYLNFSFKSYESLIDAQDLNHELFQMEQISNDTILDGYYQVITNQTKQIVSEFGLEVYKMNLKVDEDTSSEKFGTILHMELFLKFQSLNTTQKVETKIDPITIEPITLDDDKKNEPEIKKNSMSAMEIQIKKRLTDFYNIESDNINIIIQEDHDGEE